MRFNFNKRKYTSAMERTDRQMPSAEGGEHRGLKGEVYSTPGDRPYDGAALFDLGSMLMRTSSQSRELYCDCGMELGIVALAHGEEYSVRDIGELIYITQGIAEVTLQGSPRGRRTLNTVGRDHAVAVPRLGMCTVKNVGRAPCMLIYVRQSR